MLKSIGGKLREVANGLQNSSRSNSINETTSPEQIEETNRHSNREANTTTEGEDAGNVKDAATTSDTEGDETLKRRDSDQTSWQDLGDQSGLELRDHSGSDFLVQPGRVIHLRRLSSQRPVAQSKHATAFTDIPLSTRMMTDHIPMVYESAILEICERMKAERIEKMQEVANRFRRVASIELNSPSQHLPARVLSPGSDFKQSVADGVKNKTEKQKLANAAPSSREEGEEETQPSSSDATASTETPSSSKGWQAVQNFFSTLLDSPGGGEGDDGDARLLSPSIFSRRVACVKKSDGGETRNARKKKKIFSLFFVFSPSRRRDSSLLEEAPSLDPSLPFFETKKKISPYRVGRARKRPKRYFHFNEIPTSRAPYKTRAHAIRAPTF